MKIEHPRLGAFTIALLTLSGQAGYTVRTAPADWKEYFERGGRTDSRDPSTLPREWPLLNCNNLFTGRPLAEILGTTNLRPGLKSTSRKLGIA